MSRHANKRDGKGEVGLAQDYLRKQAADVSSRQEPARPLTISHIEALRTQIDEHLKSCFPTAHESKLSDAIRHGLLAPGKRLRPIITILACRQSGGDDAPALEAGCAVEMTHTASLVMDDMPSMDDANLRRGFPTTHRVYGESAAMLATISLVNESYRKLSSIEAAPSAARLRAIDHLTRAVGPEGLAGGQERDLAAPIDDAGATLSDMQQRHLLKTGALFAAAAAIGGEIAGADEHAIAQLEDFGRQFGLAYQAFDDVVDTTCSPDQVGKDVEQDMRKSTVVSLLGPEGARACAERWLAGAIDSAKAASKIGGSPLADFAGEVGSCLRSMTSDGRTPAGDAP